MYISKLIALPWPPIIDPKYRKPVVEEEEDPNLRPIFTKYKHDTDELRKRCF